MSDSGRIQIQSDDEGRPFSQQRGPVSIAATDIEHPHFVHELIRVRIAVNMFVCDQRVFSGREKSFACGFGHGLSVLAGLSDSKGLRPLFDAILYHGIGENGIELFVETLWGTINLDPFKRGHPY
jgi:hypothetical protein